jgi:trans-aconitate 2-methyltransferase
MPWNPEQYHRFQAERSAPFDDLLNLVQVRSGLRVVDLGCGTGELTQRLADHLPASQVTGLDSSQQMLEKAAHYAQPGLRFHSGDQASLSGEWDLIFSNAALQWSEDHPALLSHIFTRLAPGGQLAVQVPSNHDHISHRLILETARTEPFRTMLGGFTRISPVLSVEDYARLFFELGAENIIVFQKVYPHVLASADAVVDWISGTALVPYFERLGDGKQAFIDSLLTSMRTALPGSPVFYPFKRTFFSVHRPGA